MCTPQYSGSIYVVINRINNKKYVGQTIQTVESRFKQHLWGSGCPKFHNAIKHYGKKNFIIRTLKVIVCNSSKVLYKQLDYWERFYISYYNTIESGYNLMSGGQGECRKMSEETRKKMSLSHIGKPSGMLGKKLSTETKQKLSERFSGKNNPMYGIPSPMTGKKHSDEIRKKISNKLMGHTVSEDCRKKISEANTGRTAWNAKPVVQYDLNGNLIREFESASSAAKSFGSKYSHITDVCNGLRRSCFGYIWKWKNYF